MTLEVLFAFKRWWCTPIALSTPGVGWGWDSKSSIQRFPLGNSVIVMFLLKLFCIATPVHEYLGQENISQVYLIYYFLNDTLPSLFSNMSVLLLFTMTWLLKQNTYLDQKQKLSG